MRNEDKWRHAACRDQLIAISPYRCSLLEWRKTGGKHASLHASRRAGRLAGVQAETTIHTYAFWLGALTHSPAFAFRPNRSSTCATLTHRCSCTTRKPIQKQKHPPQRGRFVSLAANWNGADCFPGGGVHHEFVMQPSTLARLRFGEFENLGFP